MTFDSRDMAARGRIGGFSKAAMYGPDELTGPARRGFMARFYKDLPEGLPEAERTRRAECLLKAHMATLARRSALSRSNGKHTLNRTVNVCLNANSPTTRG